MLIERIRNYEGDPDPVVALEEQWEMCRGQLAKIARYGLQGRGAPALRAQIAVIICELKRDLLATGAYREAKDFKDYWGEML